MTQRGRILAALQIAGPAGLCVTDMGRIEPGDVLTMRNRIAELRAEGVPIDSTRCAVHRHRSTVARYTLLEPLQVEDRLERTLALDWTA